MSDMETTRIVARRPSPSQSDLTETVPVGGAARRASDEEEDGHTRVFRPTKPQTASGTASPSVESKEGDYKVEPVVGWLVIVNGPGKGIAKTLGYGMNSIGRGAEARLSLDFGDEQISRKGHAMLTYDPKGRRYYIQHGEGTNLTYVNDVPVLQPTEIKGREMIGIGNTKLCFIPFCGGEFDWQDS